MPIDVARVRERVRQLRAAHDAETRTATADRRESGGDATGALVAGARAFDTVTGQHVEVVSVGRENIIVSATKRADG